MSEKHPPFHYELEPRGGYLFVKVRGKMVSREEMVAYQAAMTNALTPEMRSRLMVDGRDAERPSIELRAEMWTWMSKTLRRVAIIANEERTTQRVARSAEINRMGVTGFHSIEEGEAWLLGEIED